MEQVSQYLDGERDYTLIKGGTGPLVYPAAHVYIYSALHYVTDGGKDILLAQIIFGGLYLGTLGLVMACYRAAKVRPLAIKSLVPFADSGVVTGTAIRLSSPDSVQASTQSIRSPIVQRLLRCGGIISGHLCVSKTIMDDR